MPTPSETSSTVTSDRRVLLDEASTSVYGEEWVKFFTSQTDDMQRELLELMGSDLRFSADGTPMISIRHAAGLQTWATKKPFTLSSSKGGSWVSKVKKEQDDALLQRWASRSAADSKKTTSAMSTVQTAWSKQTRNDALEWYNSHIKTDVVHVMLLAFTEAKWTTKVEAINFLLEREIGFIPFQLARLLYCALGSQEISDSEFPVAVLINAALSGEKPGAPTAEDLARTTATERSLRIQKANDDLAAARLAHAAAMAIDDQITDPLPPVPTPPGSPIHQPSAPPRSSAIQITPAEIAAIVRELTKEKAPVPTSTESRYDAFIASQHKKVKNFEFMNLAEFSPEALRAAREKLCSASMQKVTHSTVAGLQVVHDIPNPEFKSTEDRYWLTGLDEYIRILSADPKTAHRVQDILAWRVQLFSTINVSVAQKVIYAKEFMFTYRGHANAHAWCEKFANDHALRAEFLIRDSPLAPTKKGAAAQKYTDAERLAYNKAQRERKTAANRRWDDGPRNQPNAQNGRRGRDMPYSRDNNGRGDRPNNRETNDRNNNRDRDRNDRPIQISDRPCRSRVGKNEVCAYGDKCRFSHKCQFCDRSHAAKDCQSWTVDKAEAVNAKFNMRIKL